MTQEHPDPGPGSEAPAPVLGAGSRRHWLVSLLWVLAVVVGYCVLFEALGQTFHIENTSAAVARAASGRAWSLPITVAVVALALVPLRRQVRGPVPAVVLVAAPAVLATSIAQVDASGIVGLLLLLVTTPLVLAGLVLGALPAAKGRTSPRPERRMPVVLAVAGCGLLTVVLVGLALVAGL